MRSWQEKKKGGATYLGGGWWLLEEKDIFFRKDIEEWIRRQVGWGGVRLFFFEYLGGQDKPKEQERTEEDNNEGEWLQVSLW